MNGEASVRTLTLGEQHFRFVPIELVFVGDRRENVFAAKNNRTLRETLAHRRYSSLIEKGMEGYVAHFEMPLGLFLLKLKNDEDLFYRKFLNKYGDLVYSTFHISDRRLTDKKGVYLYYLNDALKYIGRCKDSMYKRINQGYGKIHPKNCYRDGQATNCHLNARITEAGSSITLWFHMMRNHDKIEDLERRLIGEYNPPWNIQWA